MSDEEDWEEDNQPSDAAPTATIHSIKELVPERDDEEEWQFPALDWKRIVPPDTFLWEYMQAVCQDDSPEEYHFWNGLLALGQAVGRNVTLYDDIPVVGNLFVCALGTTGSGKSKSGRHLRRVLNDVLPFDPVMKKDGCRIVSNPGSGEVLVQAFENIEPSPIAVKAGATPTPAIPGVPAAIPGMRYPVRGLIMFAELAGFSSKAGSQGNTLKPFTIEFYDAGESISTSAVGKGFKEAVNPFASVLSTTQPRVLKNIMSSDDIDSGFLNRWLFIGGVPKPAIAIGGAAIDYDPAKRELESVHRHYGPATQLTWSPDAENLFTEFHGQVLVPTKRQDETMLLTRIDLTMKKLCLLLTVNKKMSFVDAETVISLQPIYDYLMACYGISGSAISTSSSEELQETVMRIVNVVLPGHAAKELAKQRAKGELNPVLRTAWTAREIGQRLPARWKKKKTEFGNAMTQLTKSGDLEQTQIDGPIISKSFLFRKAS